MNLSTAVFLINDNARAIMVSYNIDSYGNANGAGYCRIIISEL